MNYIRHQTGLFERFAEDGRISPYHISLYFALFQFWNRNRFRNPFPVSREELMFLSHIGSVNTYTRCIKELHQWGYIEYLPSFNRIPGVKLAVPVLIKVVVKLAIKVTVKVVIKLYIRIQTLQTVINKPTPKILKMEEKKEIKTTTHSTPTSTKTTPNPYKDIAEFKNGMYMFDFPMCRKWLEGLGRQQYGKHFRLYPEDYRVVYNLIVYAIEDKKETDKQNLNLKKGILLTGPIGTGKSTLMALLKYFFQPGKQYQIKSTRDITFEFENEGYKVINRYSKNPLNLSYTNPTPNIFCFDDLGVEQPQKHFGNECNVMAEILLSRYDLFISKGIPTHLTTNLSASEIEGKYGNRVRSRIREMFNLVAFDKNAKDKRS